jgi:hypothetical protein
LDRHLHIA